MTIQDDVETFTLLKMPTEAVRTTDEDTGSRTYTHPVTGEELWSVTTVLGATEGKPWLQKWAAKLAAEYAVDNLDMLARIKVCDSRDAAVKLAKDQAKILRERKADAGSYVHAVIEALHYWAGSPTGMGAAVPIPEMPEHLAGTDYDGEPIEKVVDFMIGGFINFVADFRPQLLAAEMAVYDRGLGVAGTLDSIMGFLGYGITPEGDDLFALPGNRLTLCIDAKTGREPDVTYPEQLASYRRCPECLVGLGEIRALPKTDGGAVLHLRPEYERGYRLMLIARDKDARAWNRFRRAVELFTGREAEKSKPGKVIRPLRADGTMPPVQCCDLDGEGYGRAPGALHRAGVSDLELLTVMTETECLDLKGIGPKSIPIIRQMLAEHGMCLAGEDLQKVA
jgi:hypothetical protein